MYVELVVRWSLSQKSSVGKGVQSGLKFWSGLKPLWKTFCSFQEFCLNV